MKIILSKGRYSNMEILVDDEDYNKVSGFKWCIQKRRVKTGDVYYCKCPELGAMHRYLMSAKENQIVDHANGNGLDNQRKNLRFCTRSQNSANRTGKNKYLGVSAQYDGFRAAVMKNGIRYRSGILSEIEAALWYNKMAAKLHGEFARFNQISEDDIIGD